MDLLEKRKERRWGRRFYWGDLCWWCARMVSIRYSHKSIPQVIKFVTECPSQKQEARELLGGGLAQEMIWGAQSRNDT